MGLILAVTNFYMKCSYLYIVLFEKYSEIVNILFICPVWFVSCTIVTHL